MSEPGRKDPIRMNLFQVNLFVRDFKRSLHFYRDQLGFTVIDINPGPEHVPLVNWVSLSAGSVMLELFDATSAGRASAEQRSDPPIELAFIVDDVYVTRERLAAEGIKCSEVAVRAWGRCSHFSDPDGNPLQIYDVSDTGDASRV